MWYLQEWTDVGSAGVMTPPEAEVLEQRNRRKASRGDQAERGLLELLTKGA